MLRRLDRVDDLQKEATVRRAVSVANPVVLDLAPGHWSMELASERWWMERHLFFVGPEKTEVSAELWPAGVVTGGVGTAVEGAAVPAELTARFQAADDRPSFPAGDVTCPVTDGTFRCRVPAGKLDLRIRAPGYIARYAWNVSVERDAATRVPNVVLAKGASLAGRVQVGTGPRARGVKREQIRVTAIAVNAAAGVTSSDALLRYTVTPAKRGHFQFDGLPPGRYAVQASAAANALLSEEVEVVVLADVLAEMREPLRIEEPRRLRVTVVPPVDPWGERWRATLTRFTAAGGQDVAAAAAVGDGGDWISTPLRSGKYELAITARRGGTWDRRDVEMQGEPVNVEIDLSPRRVTGRVTLGDEPLASTVVLTSGWTSIPLQADAGGEFEGYLPVSVPDAWTAQVESRTPAVRHRFVDVLPKEGEGAGGSTLELRIPLTTLHGELVLEDGSPVHGIVNVTSKAQGLVQSMAEQDGRFAVHGLSPGTYTMQASGFLVESDVREIVVTESRTPDPVRIVLREQRKVPGRVVSDRAPVAGAQVYLVAAGVRQQMVGAFETDARGEFSGWVSPGARAMDVAIAAPGFDFRLFRAAVPAAGLQVTVDQRGGTIIMPAAQGELRPFLQHAGATLYDLSLLERWHIVPAGEDQFAAAAMEPGPWSVCMIRYDEREALLAGTIDRAERCSEGFLAPYGTLTFGKPAILRKQKRD